MKGIIVILLTLSWFDAFAASQEEVIAERLKETAVTQANIVPGYRQLEASKKLFNRADYGHLVKPENSQRHLSPGQP